MVREVGVKGVWMIAVQLRFWTSIVGEPGGVVPKNAWTSGVVRIERSETHGIVPGSPRTFQSLSDLGTVVEKVLIEHGVTLHISKKVPPKPRSLETVGMSDSEGQWERKLEEFGAENVRMALYNNTFLPIPDNGIAWRWLREKDAGRRQSERAFARWTLIIAIVAAVAATVAATAAVIPLVIPVP